MATKQEIAAENRQKREELAQQRQPISHSNDIDYPLTNPAKKAQQDRVSREKDDAYAKPYPTDSNLVTHATVHNEPVPQSPEEFKETGGVKVTDDAKTAEAKSSGTQENVSVSETDSTDKTTKSSKKK